MSDRVHQVTLDHIPRAAFHLFHNRSKRKTVIGARRRAGRTYSVIQDLIARALKFKKKNPKTGEDLPKPVFAYVCPYPGPAQEGCIGIPCRVYAKHPRHQRERDRTLE